MTSTERTVRTRAFFAVHSEQFNRRLKMAKATRLFRVVLEVDAEQFAALTMEFGDSVISAERADDGQDVNGKPPKKARAPSSHRRIGAGVTLTHGAGKVAPAGRSELIAAQCAAKEFAGRREITRLHLTKIVGSMFEKEGLAPSGASAAISHLIDKGHLVIHAPKLPQQQRLDA